MRSLYFYAESYSPRLHYILDVLGERWGIEWITVQNWGEFLPLNQPKINYSSQFTEYAINLSPQALLFDENIEIFDFKTLEADPLAMIFFLFSRYEEYVIAERDEHQRFSSISSYLYQTNRLQKPWADILIDDLKEKIQDKFPAIEFKKSVFTTNFTIDIDQVFQYKHKSFKRFLGGTIRDVLQWRVKHIIQRKLSYFHLKQDPWDVYLDLYNLSLNKENQPNIFFLIGDRGRHNDNLNPNNKAFHKVIKKVDKWAKIGMHPSYGSMENLDKIKTEKLRLEKMLGKPIIYSRQHYIQFTLPQTYQNLIQAGITHDFSMGYADDIGFRAGTSHPFYWYDLGREESTSLKIHPFCAMDVTLKNYLKLSVQESEIQLNQIKKDVEAVGGIFSIIGHNESLSNTGEWKDWGKMILKFWE